MENKAVTKESVSKHLGRLISAFPNCSDGFISLLIERIVENKFTENQLECAINHVIDTNVYGRLNIAEIISAKHKFVDPSVKLGPKEWIGTDGKRYYGFDDCSHPYTVPMEAPPRPDEKAYFDKERGKWWYN